MSLQRAMAFIKRLSMLSLHTLPNASVGLLSANRAAMHVSVHVGYCGLMKEELCYRDNCVCVCVF